MRPSLDHTKSDAQVGFFFFKMFLSILSTQGGPSTHNPEIKSPVLHPLSQSCPSAQIFRLKVTLGGA